MDSIINVTVYNYSGIDVTGHIDMLNPDGTYYNTPSKRFGPGKTLYVGSYDSTKNSLDRLSHFIFDEPNYTSCGIRLSDSVMYLFAMEGVSGYRKYLEYDKLRTDEQILIANDKYYVDVREVLDPIFQGFVDDGSSDKMAAVKFEIPLDGLKEVGLETAKEALEDIRNPPVKPTHSSVKVTSTPIEHPEPSSYWIFVLIFIFILVIAAVIVLVFINRDKISWL